MSLVLNLPPDLEERLRHESERQGIRMDQFALHLLEKQLSQQAPDEIQRRKDAIALLQSWIDDPDKEEQIETGNFLIQALDEDRLSDRKLFPPDLKGVTW